MPDEYGTVSSNSVPGFALTHVSKEDQERISKDPRLQAQFRQFGKEAVKNRVGQLTWEQFQEWEQLQSSQSSPSSQSSQGKDAPNTDIAGILGGIVGGSFGPALAAAAGVLMGGAALPAVAVYGAVKFITDNVAKIIEKTSKGKFKPLGVSDIENRVLDMFNIAKPDTPIERIIQAGTEGVVQTGASLGLAQFLKSGTPVGQQLMGNTTRDAVANVLTQNPGAQVAENVASEAVAQGAEELGFGQVGQTVAGVAGGVLTSGVAGMVNKGKAISKLPPSEADLVARKAEDAGIPVSTTDILNRKRGLKQPIELQPGMRDFGITQEKGRQALIESFVNEYGVPGGTETKATRELYGDISSNRLSKIQNLKEPLENITKRLNGVPIETSNTVASIDKAIEEMSKNITTLDENELNLLRGLRADLVKDPSFNNVELLRRRFAENYTNIKSTVQGKSVDIKNNQIYSSLAEDLRQGVKKNLGENEYSRWSTSNKELSKMALELENNALRRALNKGKQNPEVILQALKSKNESGVSAVYNSLTGPGKLSAQGLVIRDIYNRSLDKITQSLDPNTFLKNLNEMDKNLGVVFKGKSGEALEGVKKILQLTNQAGARGSFSEELRAGLLSNLVKLFSGVGYRIYNSKKVYNLLSYAGKSKSVESMKFVEKSLTRLLAKKAVTSIAEADDASD